MENYKHVGIEPAKGSLILSEGNRWTNFKEVSGSQRFY